MADSDFSFEDSMGALSAHTSKALAENLTRRFRENGISISIDQMVVLIHLWREDGQAQQQLGKRAGHHKTMVTRAIDSLEVKNMVVRVPDPQDGRIRRVYLTHRGKTIREQILPCARSTHAEALKGIDEQALAVCKSVLRQVIHNLGQDNGDPQC